MEASPDGNAAARRAGGETVGALSPDYLRRVSDRARSGSPMGLKANEFSWERPDQIGPLLASRIARNSSPSPADTESSLLTRPLIRVELLMGFLFNYLCIYLFFFFYEIYLANFLKNVADRRADLNCVRATEPDHFLCYATPSLPLHAEIYIFFFSPLIASF